MPPIPATTLPELLARWDSPEGHPYKGMLIDWPAYQADPDSISCFCAQGQALHILGGWSPERLRYAEQIEADAGTAKLLNISRAHAILLRSVNDSIDGAPSIVLTDPGKVLGSEWSRLLDFWWHLDRMTAAQWAAAWDAARDAAWDAARDAAWAAAWAAAWDAAWAAAQAAARDAAWAAARDAAWDAARDAAWDAARDAAWDAARAAAWAAARDAAWAAAWAAARDAAWDAARDAAWAAAWDAAWAAANAASEIQGAHLLRERGKPFYFLPLFGFADPEAIPARPANYGEA